MRQCPLKYTECPLKRPLSGRIFRSFEIQVAKATNGQKNGFAEESTIQPRLTHYFDAYTIGLVSYWKMEPEGQFQVQKWGAFPTVLPVRTSFYFMS